MIPAAMSSEQRVALEFHVLFLSDVEHGGPKTGRALRRAISRRAGRRASEYAQLMADRVDNADALDSGGRSSHEDPDAAEDAASTRRRRPSRRAVKRLDGRAASVRTRSRGLLGRGDRAPCIWADDSRLKRRVALKVLARTAGFESPAFRGSASSARAEVAPPS